MRMERPTDSVSFTQNSSESHCFQLCGHFWLLLDLGSELCRDSMGQAGFSPGWYLLISHAPWLIHFLFS